MSKSRAPPFASEAEAHEDAIEVYSDPIDEEGSSDCDCLYAFVASLNGGEPVARCVHCGRLAK